MFSIFLIFVSKKYVYITTDDKKMVTALRFYFLTYPPLFSTHFLQRSRRHEKASSKKSSDSDEKKTSTDS